MKYNPSIIYLDHNATTQPLPEVVEAMVHVQTKFWGNSNSTHNFGLQVNSLISIAEKRIKDYINGHSGRIIWTNSGSQANHLAITGICKSTGHLLTTMSEHKSIEDLRRKYGIGVSNHDWKRYYNSYTELISLIYVNNETGLISHPDLVTLLLKGSSTYLHLDAVQALGKVKIDVEELGCDLMTLSAHKIYGPKGTGCLWVRDGVHIEIPYLGTPNVPGIVGFGEALKIHKLYLYRAELQEKEEALLSGLQENNIEYKLNIPIGPNKVPGTLSIVFKDINRIELALELSSKGVMISTGSACSGTESSRVLRELNLSEEDINSTVRISLGKQCSLVDIFNTVQIISETVKELKYGL